MKQQPVSKLRSTHLKGVVKNEIDYELPAMALLLVAIISLLLLITV